MSDNLLYNGYLGGHAWITHIDKGSLEYLKEKYNISTMLDIGCGPGEQVAVAQQLGIDALGIDGDPRVVAKNLANIVECDFTKTSYLEKTVDLIWSCEFLEHVYEEFQQNYMKTFQQGKYCFVTHALPGIESVKAHHVNCKDDQYWIDVFAQYGFEHEPEVTGIIRTEKSTMKREFVRESGLFFINRARQ